MAGGKLAAAAGLVVALPLSVVVMFLGAGGGVAADVQGGQLCTVQAGGSQHAAGAGSTVLTGAQLTNARTIVAAAKALQLPQQAAGLALMTALQESQLRNLANPTLPTSQNVPHDGQGSDLDSAGLFQQRPSQGWGSPVQVMDPGFAAAAFLSRLAQVPGWQTLPPYAAAQKVQASADPSLYTKWQPLGDALAGALWQGTTGTLVCASQDATGPAGFRAGAGSSQALTQVLTFALAQLGKPYLFGGTGPDSYDCSGLVVAAYRTAMITLPRTSGPQYLTGVAQGQTVPLAAAQPGDLIFFNPGEAGAPPDQPGHVGIYLGDGMMIDAPHTGTVIREEPVDGFGQLVGVTRPSAATRT